jgi:hypothetical protein
MAEWKELWLKNYKGQGDTAELEKSLKTLGYGARTNISYLPWAVVERIFRLQDGEVHWLPASEKSNVDVDEVIIGSNVDTETGETTHRSIRSYFINIQAVWNGREYTERYPLQDSNGRPLTNWTQNELNKAFQRGKVKAIAIVSGIGYKLFEDGDLQFEEEQPKAPQKATQPKIVAEPKDDFNRLEIEQTIKREFLNGDTKAQVIKKFLVDNEVKKVNELNDLQVKELNELVK